MSNGDQRSYRGGPIIAAALALLLLVGYVGAYFGLSEFEGDPQLVHVRTFGSRWQPKLFWPALMIEKRVRGKPMVVGVESDLWHSPVD